MDSMIRMAIIGGDARYLELIKKLSEKENYYMELVGFDQLDQGFTGVKQTNFDELEVEDLDVIILPIPGIDEDGYIETVFSNKKIQITKNWFNKLKKGCLIFSGITTPYLSSNAEKVNARLLPLMQRDDVAIYNSIPTTEGAIMLAIQHTNFTIHSSRVLVLGLGRVGHSVASKFAGLGADVVVGTKKDKDIARAIEMGLEAFHMEELTAYTGQCDILINTIPAKVVTEGALNQMKSNALIIDLASKPGGVDFNHAKQRGITALQALGLPGMVAPKTAGEILAKTINQLIITQ
ncbi:dipicolinate synthase subunit A [Paraliobacillus quinghaiensis]|uniref:Dipicolinate synthase subunit A n=1 Tax=Paraliobacillus quinghaiensis TaxID=470815 RepID=A0A917WQP5_9BACI|nr:dipicolinic acid synthetase subunit A [Paraliobacillus quinghaiensis]GGM21798.1 dipicolinate synthase subunit A [Paraliobacillus quinghaiensis]